MITHMEAHAAALALLRALLAAGVTWITWQPWQYLAFLPRRWNLLSPYRTHLHNRHLRGSGSGGSPVRRRWDRSPACRCSGDIGIWESVIITVCKIYTVLISGEFLGTLPADRGTLHLQRGGGLRIPPIHLLAVCVQV